MNFFELEELENGIAILRVSREKVLNALNDALIGEGIEILHSLYQKLPRVLIITGKGEKSFVAGADISELQQAQTVEAGLEIAKKGKKFFDLIAAAPFITIAAINGFALGGGFELALSCDLRYAGENAKVGLPEVGLGLIPGYGGTQRLLRLAGRGIAAEYIYTGKMVGAAEALSHGILNQVFPKETLMEEVGKIAKQIAKNGPVALRVAKELLNEGENLSLEKAQEAESCKFASLFVTEDRLEGTGAFLEKRKPVFRGK